ncbi:inositol polyphosphate multikinase-like isoform X2 [Macrosteles quadrilineatus]|uniref:inositol polyphosphate multikinase-like isoform X2 n=1 Tax=Macrosteles quadrilineatus TaxID=74068 RepID=UPI0023E2F205|nr:inositol polyphosphate multikinase-like isoform X2 [Macrosteles quadrilineatus]
MFKCQHEDRSHINLFFFYSATHHNHLLRMAAQEQDLCPNKEALEKYPKNTKPLENQVAGHSFSDGCHTIGMLRDEDGHVLKPVNKPEQGRKEIEFYETLSKYETDDILQLKQFVPQYFGSVILSIDGRSAQFLKLLDATRGYKKPCVMDVKIGRQTWEPGAPVEKQLREEVGTFEKYGKDYGRRLQRDDIVYVFKKFLNSGTERGRVVAEEMLRQVTTILDWWRVQRTFHMYSSSVLLTYDAEPNLTPSVRVVLIDFAHVLPANGSPDLNYLTGLESFVHIFTSVLNEL